MCILYLKEEEEEEEQLCKRNIKNKKRNLCEMEQQEKHMSISSFKVIHPKIEDVGLFLQIQIIAINSDVRREKLT